MAQLPDPDKHSLGGGDVPTSGEVNHWHSIFQIYPDNYMYM